MTSKKAPKRFLVDGDVVTDATTGLIWTRENVAPGRLNWAAAKSACAKATTGGHKDWRLPTVQELLTLVDYGRHVPAIDPAFKCESAWYWSSTRAAYSPSGYAWFVYFRYGYSGWYGQGGEFHVRAVRAGQSLAVGKRRRVARSKTRRAR